MSNRAVKITVGVFIGLLLAGGLFTAGMVTGFMFQGIWQGAHALLPNVISAPSNSTFPSLSLSNNSVSQDTIDLFDPFWESWDVVHDEFVDQPVDDVQLMRGAIQGMLGSLGDPNTSYLDPDTYLQANTRLAGEYEGIGVYVDSTVEYLTVISTMSGSPAEEAGLKPGDEVIAVDGEDMTGIDGTQVVRRILGEAGTPVTLTIRREGEAQPLEFTIIRAKITVPSVESEMLEGGLVYVRVHDFGDNTTRDLRSALRSLVNDQAKGLILDLRENPGGLLNTSVDVASEFMDGGVVLYERFGDGEEQVYRATDGGLATDIPMVVLIDGGSASASEIVAGAIQDSERGILIGETSYGKGSVQNWRDLAEDAGAIRVTVARWFTPNNRQINEIGLTPDIEVVQPEEDNGTDVQLQEAMDYLTNLSN